MSNHALEQNCRRCPHWNEPAAVLGLRDSPCPQDRLGRQITPEVVRRRMPADWECPTLARTVTPDQPQPRATVPQMAKGGAA
jgi:hypothetical protein